MMSMMFVTGFCILVYLLVQITTATFELLFCFSLLGVLFGDSFFMYEVVYLLFVSNKSWHDGSKYKLFHEWHIFVYLYIMLVVMITYNIVIVFRYLKWSKLKEFGSNAELLTWMVIGKDAFTSNWDPENVSLRTILSKYKGTDTHNQNDQNLQSPKASAESIEEFAQHELEMEEVKKHKFLKQVGFVQRILCGLMLFGQVYICIVWYVMQLETKVDYVDNLFSYSMMGVLSWVLEIGLFGLTYLLVSKLGPEMDAMEQVEDVETDDSDKIDEKNKEKRIKKQKSKIRLNQRALAMCFIFSIF